MNRVSIWIMDNVPTLLTVFLIWFMAILTYFGYHDIVRDAVKETRYHERMMQLESCEQSANEE